MKNILKTIGLGFILTSVTNTLANTLPPTPEKEANTLANSLPPTPEKEANALANSLPPTPEKEANALANTLPPTLECIAHYTTKIYINKQHVRC